MDHRERVSVKWKVICANVNCERIIRAYFLASDVTIRNDLPSVL